MPIRLIEYGVGPFNVNVLSPGSSCSVCLPGEDDVLCAVAAPRHDAGRFCVKSGQATENPFELAELIFLLANNVITEPLGGQRDADPVLRTGLAVRRSGSGVAILQTPISPSFTRRRTPFLPTVQESLHPLQERTCGSLFPCSHFANVPGSTPRRCAASFCRSPIAVRCRTRRSPQPFPSGSGS